MIHSASDVDFSLTYEKIDDENFEREQQFMPLQLLFD